MALITMNTDYAIRALCHMALKKDEIVSAAELANEMGISWSLLRKILQELNRKGLVRSYKGKGGGFTLEVPAQKIYILELIKMFQGLIQFNKCRTKYRTCSHIKSCELRKKFSSIEKYVVSELQSITIASLLIENLAGT